jgi:hypothetical protein
MKVLLNETRLPMSNVKSKAFPSFKQHIEKIKNWRPSFEVKESKANEVRHKSQKEFFDRPIEKPEQKQVYNGLTTSL